MTMESKKTRNILLSCAVIIIVTCICLGLILISGVGVSTIWPFDFGSGAVIPPPVEVSPFTPEVEVEDPVDPLPTVVVTPEAAETLPDDIAEIVLEIEAQVSQIRGLTLTNPVPRILMSPEELEDVVVNEFFADYTDEDARQDVLVLSLLGLLPPNFDLKNFYNELYSEQIAGFYDSETQEIYIVKGVAFGASEKLTYAHEFTHVLQDQTFRFDEGMNYNEEACEADSERCAAIQALIEGDASYTEVLWFQTHATRADYLDLLQTFEDISSPVFDAAPPYIQADLYFPYEKGFAFVEFLFDQSGYEAIDAAFLDPPVSTEQILHPDRYPWDQPQPVVLPNLEAVLGDSWVLFDENVMGEWYTYLILAYGHDESYQIAEDQAQQAAAGWGGDAYAFYHNEGTDELIFILDMVWDTRLDADEFMVALASYAGLRWSPASQQVMGQPTWEGSDGTVVLLQDGDRTLWVIAPTNNLAEILISELQ
jgi:hypothetical protein